MRGAGNEGRLEDSLIPKQIHETHLTHTASPHNCYATACMMGLLPQDDASLVSH